MVEAALRDRNRVAAEAAARLLAGFDDYYTRSRRIPWEAQQAFETRDPAQSLFLSRQRLSRYSDSARKLADALAETLPDIGEDEALWNAILQAYEPLVEGRYEADLARAYCHSVRRLLLHDEWRPVDYSFGARAGPPSGLPRGIVRAFPGASRLEAEQVASILEIPNFSAPWRDFAGDCAEVAACVNERFGLRGDKPGAIDRIEMIDAGFFRNRGAYLVGRLDLAGQGSPPLVLALENDAGGLFVDAVLTREADVHNIFSSTLANFHVTQEAYHELARFLHRIMPARPLGLHYSTIGFNHVGKVAVMEELEREQAETGECFAIAPGSRGTVAIAFTAASSAYVLKVIRDRPTRQYKWGQFQGVDSVLRKYGQVHEINRTGSMLDNIIYRNVALAGERFDPELIAELAEHAPSSVARRGEGLVFRHLIVQPKMTPLPIFLESASREAAEAAIANLGHCIKNNAAANIFNKDLDIRNYGVSRFLKVFLFDYDALEPLASVKIRTNSDRVDGEEDIPPWFFEKGVIFLPEEIEANLKLSERALRRFFRDRHGDLLTTEYWEAMQAAILKGRLPRISVYPDSTRLRRTAS